MEIIENLPFPSPKRASRERPLEAASAINISLTRNQEYAGGGRACVSAYMVDPRSRGRFEP